MGDAGADLGVAIFGAVCSAGCGAPVEAVRFRTGDERIPRCTACAAAEKAARVEAEAAAEREHRDGEADERGARILQLLEECHVDTAGPHGEATLEGFDPNPDREALRAAQEFVRQFRAGERPNLFLYSKRPTEGVAPGSGKTHLAVAILRALLLSGDVTPRSARFVRETRVTITLRRLIREGAPEDYLDELIRQELLILDDVGKAKTDSPWLRELMFELVAGRESRATIITSNFSPGDLIKQDEAFRPLVSRIIAKGPAKVLVGPDRRARAA